MMDWTLWSDPPVVFATALSAALGLVVGSFVNVVVARLPHHKSLVRPGSRCPHCAHALTWYENVPLLSYLALRGRCRACHKAISPRYPVIELMTALLFVAALKHKGWGPELWLREWPWMAILVAITFIDLEHRIIPDPLNFTGLALGLATAGLSQELGWVGAFSGAGLGFLVFYGFAWAYEKASGRAGLGGGDIKLLAMLGAFLGPRGVLTCILVSSIAGSVIGIAWSLGARKKKILTTAIPFGPFLVIGALYYDLLGEGGWPWSP